MQDRKFLDKIFASMFSNPKYNQTYLFYAHILSQCAISLDDSIPLAGVSFDKTQFRLWINPKGMEELSLEQQLGVLKHEALHILYNHIGRGKNLHKKVYNVATDTAINQQIERSHLPEDGCFPDTVNLPENLSAEQYYELLFKEDRVKFVEPNAHTDGHSKWEESEGDVEMIKEKAKQMCDKAMDKARGNLPNCISEILEILNKKPQITWQRELRKIVGQRKVNKKRTLLREARRFEDRPDIKGTIKDRKFDLAVILDVSGSMSDNEISYCLTEVKSICKLTETSLKIVQVDTEVKGVVDFDKNAKRTTRKGSGGTYLEPAIDYLRENRIAYDALLVLTDGGCERVDTWRYIPRCPVFFVTTQMDVPGVQNVKRFKQFKLKVGA